MNRRSGRSARVGIPRAAWLPCGSMLIFLAGLTVAVPAFGQDAPEAGILSFVVENDLVSDNDRNYTSGVALVWVPTGKPTPAWALRIARWIPWIQGEGHVRHGYAFGQTFFTPRDITLVTPPLDDRPYAGWLYATVGLGVETQRRLDQLALSLGVVGPSSLAEQSQKFIHELIGADEPQGWDTQLENELGVLLTYQCSWRELAGTTLAGLDLDLAPHVGAALGNVYTYANGGLSLRYGKSRPFDYGPPRIQPSLPGSGSFETGDGFAWHLFAGFEGRAVAQNIFLDGNTFRDSRSVDREPLVGDLQAGVVLRWRRVRVGYTHIARTLEFKSQHGHDVFGALSFSMSF